MFAQVGPIAIIYDKIVKKLSNISSEQQEPSYALSYEERSKKKGIKRPNDVTSDECYVHRGFNKQYKKW